MRIRWPIFSRAEAAASGFKESEIEGDPNVILESSVIIWKEQELPLKDACCSVLSVSDRVEDEWDVSTTSRSRIRSVNL